MAESNDLTSLNNSLPENLRFKDPSAPKLPQAPSADSFLDKLDQIPSVAPDLFGDAKVRSFGQDYNQSNFDRYKSHPLYKELGFDPFRDNESLYNEHSTGWNEFQRATKYIPDLAASGFKSAIRSWGDILTGHPLAPDMESAKEFEKVMAKGSSSKGGVGGFLANTFLNSGYTFGIMGELIAEEAALMGITALSGGTLSELTLPAMGARMAKGFTTIGGLGEAIGHTYQGMKNLKSVDNAKHFWDAAKSMGKAVNPFAHTLEAAKGSKAIGEFAKKASTFGAFYRDIREINFALSEGKLEGGMVKLDLTKDLTEKFERENNRPPSPQEAEEINNIADDAALATTGANLPAIYFTNKITFDNLFRAGKGITKVAENSAGKLIGNVAKGEFKVVEKSLKNTGKDLINPKTYLNSGLHYLKANFSEGLQESIQESISTATKDYYTNIYEHKPASWLSSAGKGSAAQFSGQGLETFLGGFLMGSIMQGGSFVLGKSLNTVQKLGNKEKYNSVQDKRKEDLQKQADELTEAFKDPLNVFDPKIKNINNQLNAVEGIAEAEAAGDKKTVFDIKDAAARSMIMTAIETKHYDSLIERLEAIKDMTSEMIQEQYGRDGEKVLASIDTLIQKAKLTKARYTAWDSHMGENPFDLSQYKGKDPKTDVGYQAAILGKVTWDNAKQDAIFMQDSFDDISQRMVSIIDTFKTSEGMSDLNASDLTHIFDSEKLREEIEMLSKELESFTGLTDPASKRLKNEKSEKLKALRKYNDALEGNGDHQEAYINYINTLAKINNVKIFEKDIRDKFKLVTDFHDLKKDQEGIFRAVNILHNPNGFYNHYKSLFTTFENIYKSHESGGAIQKIKDKIQGPENKPSMYQQVLENNKIVIDPEELNRLIQDPEYNPAIIYDEENRRAVKPNDIGYNDLKVRILKAFIAAELKETQKKAEEQAVKQEQDVNSNPELQKKIDEAFNQFLIKFIADQKVVEPSYEYDPVKNLPQAKQAFEDSGIKEQIINDFKMEQEAMNSEITGSQAPLLKTGPSQKELIMMSLAKVKNELVKLENKKVKYTEQGLPTDPVDSDITALQKYIEFLTPKNIITPAKQKLIDEAVTKIKESNKDITKTSDQKFYQIDGKLYDRVTKVLKKVSEKLFPDYKTFTYKGRIAAENLFEKSIDLDNFIDNFSASKDFVGEFNIEKIKTLKDKLEKALAENKTRENPSLEKTIVGDVVQDFAYEQSRIAGNTIDDLTRVYFIKRNQGSTDILDYERDTPKDKNGLPLISPEAFISLVDHLNTMAHNLESAGYTVLTEKMVISNQERVVDADPNTVGIAGEMDMLLMDKDGGLYIWDMKTSQQHKWNMYFKGEGKKADGTSYKGSINKAEHEMQLSTYGRILKKNYGLDIKGYGIIPFTVEYNLDGFIKTLKIADDVIIKQKLQDKLDENGKTKAGEILYVSPGLGKTELVSKNDNFINGDRLLLTWFKNYLETIAQKSQVEKEVKLAEHYLEGKDLTDDTVGKLFYDYLKEQPDSKADIIKTNVIKLFRDQTLGGKSILSSNWFIMDVADKVYLNRTTDENGEYTRDHGRMMKSFADKGVVESAANEGASKRIALETSKFAKNPGKIRWIHPGEYIGDKLNPKPLAIQLKYNSDSENLVPEGTVLETPETGLSVGDNVEWNVNTNTEDTYVPGETIEWKIVTDKDIATEEELKVSQDLIKSSPMVLKVTGSIKAVWNKQTGKYEFYNNSGKKITSPNQIKKYSDKLTSTPNVLKTWWNNFISDEARTDIANNSDRYFRALEKAQQGGGHVINIEAVMMEEIIGYKFLPTDVKSNTTDINLDKWTSPEGLSVSEVAEEIMPNLLAHGFSYDELEIINLIYDTINANPNGITKRDLKNYSRSIDPTVDLLNLQIEFLEKYNLNIEDVYHNLITEIENEKEKINIGGESQAAEVISGTKTHSEKITPAEIKSEFSKAKTLAEIKKIETQLLGRVPLDSMSELTNIVLELASQRRDAIINNLRVKDLKTGDVIIKKTPGKTDKLFKVKKSSGKIFITPISNGKGKEKEISQDDLNSYVKFDEKMSEINKTPEVTPEGKDGIKNSQEDTFTPERLIALNAEADKSSVSDILKQIKDNGNKNC